MSVPLVLPPEVLTHLDGIHPLSPETLARVSGLLRSARFERGEHLVHVGQPATHLGILVEGWVRAYYLGADGAEYSKHLFQAPALVGDYASLLTGQPVITPQQALTPCTVLLADWGQVTRLYDEHRDLERLARRFAEMLYVEKERREIEIVTCTAAERLDLLVEQFPTIEHDLSLTQIASHLGITPTHLSRIRRARRSST